MKFIRCFPPIVSRLLVAAALTALLGNLAIAQQPPAPMSLIAPGLGLSGKHYIGAASTNSTLVAAGNHVVYGVSIVNTNSTPYYLKMYDKATAPTCGTDVPVAVFPLIQNVRIKDGGLFGRAFALGVGFCVVGGIADSDTSNGATGISFDVFYK